MASPKTISLVLGSGGARGLAHIGVIQWLIEQGYVIRSISGTSIGALVGGIYAAGALDVYAQWVTNLEKIDILRLLDLSFRRQGLFKGEKIISLLKEMIGDRNIESLPLSFTAVATNLQSQKEVWLNSGPLFDAIRASISIPTIFAPHNYLGQQFLDGSLVNPVPIAPTLKDTTDLTVAVDLNGRYHRHITPAINESRNGYQEFVRQFWPKTSVGIARSDTSLSFYGIMLRSMETMQARITRLQLAAYTPDITVTIPANTCSFYEFDRANELIQLGYTSTKKAFSSLK
ncbi:MAG: patatin-like phospholipase family protein [Gammaproteobacteria bacterium]|nr:patatin-like phospholipase family protein [Gammaproteobacteria bacterium]MDH5802329.1 patatin-like phospholipase family protein [Gammaproteobacteria bacterium]